MKKIITLIAPIIMAMGCNCASSKSAADKDKSYYAANKENKTLCLIPPLFVTIDDSAKSFARLKLKADPESLKDSVLTCFNAEYERIGKKYVKKNIHIINDSMRIGQSALGSYFSKQKIQSLITNGKTSDSINTLLPKKEFLDSIGITTDYIMVVTELNVLVTVVAAFFNPASLNDKFVYFAEKTFRLKGKYILWDCMNERIVSDGEFSDEVFTESMKNKKRITEGINRLFYKLFDPALFWKIPHNVFRGKWSPI